MSLKLIHIGVFVILSLMSVVYNIEIEPNETILSEISKNISRVNHILHDLMKKYERLKHLIHTDTDKINHSANDFVTMKTHFKIRAKENIKEPQKTFSATQSYTDQSTEDNVRGINKKKTLKEKKFNIKGHYRPGDTEVQLRYPLKSDGIGKTLFFTDELSENDTNETHYKRQPREKKVFGIKDTVSSDSQEDTFVTKKSQTSTTQKNIKLEENLKHKQIITQKDYLDGEILRGTTKESENPKDVKKVLVIHIDGNKNSNVNILRTSNPNEVKIPSTNKKQRTTESATRTFKSDIAADPNSDVEEHKAMQEEILRAKTLRHALGDACLLLVVKKCKKALKDVLKDVCKRNKKCSSNFNKDFTENGIAACDEEFNKPKGKTGRNVRHDKYFGDYDDDDSENDDHGQDEDGAHFVDYTRQGLLDMTCLQAISGVKKPKIAERTNLTNIVNKPHDVHILRDKLENACRKASFDKCNKACKTASDKTCKTHECVSAKEKALRKSCKKRCMASYGYRENSSSESDSDDDSDEDSDSD
ncbi:uncharacterized protein LOC134801932 isoform X2 [Cydia splendana]|uniref:uncharacterized protein LOC134801932 isoform X2 n=1 Tax=Cydia splendana TaxID=1100963 RepID=UPI0028F495B8